MNDASMMDNWFINATGATAGTPTRPRLEHYLSHGWDTTGATAGTPPGRRPGHNQGHGRDTTGAKAGKPPEPRPGHHRGHGRDITGATAGTPPGPLPGHHRDQRSSKSRKSRSSRTRVQHKGQGPEEIAHNFAQASRTTRIRKTTSRLGELIKDFLPDTSETYICM